MHKIFITCIHAIKSWLSRVAAAGCPPDPLASMQPRELADLPVSHPPVDTGCLNP